MNLIQQSRKILTALVLVLVLTVATACGATTQARTTSLPALNSSVSYQQLERGNTAVGQNFGDWVVQTATGLVKDAYVRDNNKLGVVITPQVRPNEVQTLAKSLIQGFHKNFPNQDVSVLMYAPDKKLILTADYDVQSKRVEYKGA
jgi:WD40 repeat protein